MWTYIAQTNPVLQLECLNTILNVYFVCLGGSYIVDTVQMLYCNDPDTSLQSYTRKSVFAVLGVGLRAKCLIKLRVTWWAGNI